MNLQEVNRELEGASAIERVRWAYREFGDKLVMSTSFGAQAAATLALVTSVAPEIPVVFVDTGYLFPETYRFADSLRERLNLNLRVYQPLVTAARQEALWGKRWEQGVEALSAYNFDNKVEPMNRALKELGGEAWISGLRRQQSTSRAHLRVVECQNRTHKIHPIIDWTDRDIHTFLTSNGLPYHPLWDEGYVSIGDVHSTRKWEPGMLEEETRFGGVKRECGLHEVSDRMDFQI